jgi:ABC-type Fe3+-siderophore transport system permease subunit
VAVAVRRHSPDVRPRNHRLHQYWRGPAAIIASLVGWFLAIRGALLLTVPQSHSAAGNAIYSSGAIAAVHVLAICLGLAGLYLTYIGWKPAPGTP